MNIAVIAANGRLGRVFVDEALAAGHRVRAGVRGQNDFAPHPQLVVIDCDATSAADLAKLVEGQDAVVSCIGHVKGSAPDVQTVATRTLVTVMDNLNVKRFVDVTGTGARFAGDKITLIDFVLNFAVGIIDPNRVRDGIDHMKVLQDSDLDWTTIRVLKLQNVASRPYELKLHGPTKRYVGRTEVARAMLEVIVDHSYVKQSPIIGYK